MSSYSDELYKLYKAALKRDNLQLAFDILKEMRAGPVKVEDFKTETEEAK